MSALRASRTCRFAALRHGFAALRFCATHIVVGLLVLAGLGGMPAAAQQIWFGPRQPSRRSTGVLDWGAQFRPGAPWQTVEDHLQAYFLTAAYIAIAPDDELRRIWENLQRHHVGIVLPLQSIARPRAGCGRIEGYAPPGQGTFVARKLKRLGMRIRYIRMDGPLFAGHYSTNRHACRLSVPELVQRVKANLDEYLRIFPDAVVGEVEPFPALTEQPDWQTTYRAFNSQLAEAIGRPIAFFNLDISWQNPAWRERLAMMENFVHQLGMKFGIIYDGAGYDDTDSRWMTEAQRHFGEIESDLGVIPDQAIFQSWNRFPVRALPETSPAAHTHLIMRYLLPRTRIVLNRSGEQLRGRLLDAAGRGLPDAPILVEIPTVDTGLPARPRLLAGRVPAQARSATITIALNRACNCDGPNDLLLGTITYTEGSNDQARYMVSPSEILLMVNRRPTAGDATMVATPTARVVRLTTTPQQALVFNSQPFPVDGGAPFVLRVPVSTNDGSGVYGNFSVVWRNDTGRPFTRSPLIVESDFTAVSTAATDAGGRFSFARPMSSDRQAPLRLVFAGTGSLRAAYASVQ